MSGTAAQPTLVPPPYFEAMVDGAKRGDTESLQTQNFLFATAGYPTRDAFVRSLVALSCAPKNRDRVHAIEVGIPCSDPIADGPVIEECYRVCLLNGVTSISVVFDLLEEAQRICRTEHDLPLKPIILMGYMNSIFEADPSTGVFDLRQGWGARALALGLNVRHAIIVDCTAGHIQIGGLSQALGNAGVSLIPVIAENVEDAVIEDLVRPATLAGGEIATDPVLQRKIVYCTNYLGVTGKAAPGATADNADGANGSGSASFERYLQKISQLKAAGHFILMGFGIRTLADVGRVRARFRFLPNAAVVGTAYMKGLMAFRDGKCDAAASIESYVTDDLIERIFGGEEKHPVASRLVTDSESVQPSEEKSSPSADAASGDGSGNSGFGLKVCGFKSRNQVVAALTECVDYLGFNFHRPSPRYCLADADAAAADDAGVACDSKQSHDAGEFERLEEIFQLIHDSAYHTYRPLSVSVSVISGADKVDAEMSYILGVARKCPSLDVLQLHMKVDTLLQPAVLSCIGQKLRESGKRAILAFAVAPEETADLPVAVIDCLKTVLGSSSPIDRESLFGLLIDVKSSTAVGGTGQQWHYIDPLQRLFEQLEPGSAQGVRFFVAGGVGPDYVLGQGAGGKLRALHAESRAAGFEQLAFDCCSSMESGAAPKPGDTYGPFPYAIEDFDPRDKATGDLALDKVHKSAFKIRFMSRVLKPESPLFFGQFGGAWVSSLIMTACKELTKEFATCYQDPLFWQEYDRLLRKVAGRPTGLYFAGSLTKYVRDGIAGTAPRQGRATNYMSRLTKSANNLGAPAPLPADQRGASVYLKREDLLHTGAHKINNAIYQIVMARRMGKTRIIAETGAGQHGVACAAVCAVLNEEATDGSQPMKCRVYMGAKDAARQALNVLRIESMGAELFRVQAGDKTLRAAVNETMRDWSENIVNTHYVIGSAVGPSPFPYIVREAQSCIGKEARGQFSTHPENMSQKVLPKAVVACVGGGSNCIGAFDAFVQDTGVELIGAEASGQVQCRGPATKQRLSNDGNYLHSSSIVRGSVGILHGSTNLMIQTKGGNAAQSHSACAGLDYSGVSPIHSFLSTCGRASYSAVSDVDALRAWTALSMSEGIPCALETAHAVCAGLQKAALLPRDESVIINLSGRGDKDMPMVEKLMKVLKAVDAVDSLAEFLAGEKDLDPSELQECARIMLIEADLEDARVEAAVLNFFEQFLHFLPTIEDCLPSTKDVATAVSGAADILEQRFAPNRAESPRLFKLVDTLLIFRAIMLEHFTEPFEMKADGGPTLGACIVGTGGDGGKNPHNVSTPAGIIAAAAAENVNVLKWGGPSSTGSGSGSSDVLWQLGANMNEPELADSNCIRDILKDSGFCFLFAKLSFPVMKKFAPLRAKFGGLVKAHNANAAAEDKLPVVTIFNLLGPLLNPSNPELHVFGVSDRKVLQAYALIQACCKDQDGQPTSIFPNCKRAVCVHSCDGVDKMSPMGGNLLLEVDHTADTAECMADSDYHFRPLYLSVVHAKDFGIDPVLSRTELYAPASPSLSAEDAEKLETSLKEVAKCTSEAALNKGRNAFNILQLLRPSEGDAGFAAHDPLRSFVLMNAALVLYLSIKARRGVAAQVGGAELRSILKESLATCSTALDSGKVQSTLDKYIYFSNHHAHHHRKRLGNATPAGEGIVDRICKNVVLKDLLLPGSGTTPAPADDSSCPLFDSLVSAECSPSLICEVKYRSPSVLHTSSDAAGVVVQDYLRGAGKHLKCISVLAEDTFFGGGAHVIDSVKQQLATSCAAGESPLILMKDFFLSKVHLGQARAFGAHAVLLIVCLEDRMEVSLRDMIDHCRFLGLEPVLEVAATSEFDRVMEITRPDEKLIVGVNNRDLKTFKMDLTLTPRVYEYCTGRYADRMATASCSQGVVLVSFSGIQKREDIDKIRTATNGLISSFLIGTSIMTAPHDTRSSVVRSLLGDSVLRVSKSYDAGLLPSAPAVKQLLERPGDFTLLSLDLNKVNPDLASKLSFRPLYDAFCGPAAAESSGAFAYFQIRDETIVGFSPDAVIESMEEDISGQLDWDMRSHRRFRRDDAVRYPSFRGGYLGYYGFENVAHAESTITLRPRKPNDELLTLEDMPLNSVGRYSTFLVMFADGAKAIYTTVTAGGYHGGMQRLQLYERALCDALNSAEQAGAGSSAGCSEADVKPLDQASYGEVTEDGYWSNFRRDEFLETVNDLKERIRLGELIQVVPSRTAVKDTAASPADIFAELSKVSSSSPYKYVLRLGSGFTIVGASPELLMKAEEVLESDYASAVGSRMGEQSSLVRGSGADGRGDNVMDLRKITTCPIAGTRRRGKSRQEDIDLGLDLLQDEKELSEHVMLVDLARNDIGKLCQLVTLEEFNQLRYYSNVMHICSTVSGIMRVENHIHSATVMDALKAVFPCGTLSGAPKIRACQTIVEVEGAKQRRNLYGGGLGFVSFGNTMELCIAIRTLVHRQLTPGRGRVYLQAGAGIVWDSNPEAEYDETTHKMGNLRRAIAAAESGITPASPGAATTASRAQAQASGTTGIETGHDALVELAGEVHTILAAKKASGGVPDSVLTDDRMLDMGQAIVSGVPAVNAKDIRVLLVDNYCSFTHNSFQVAAEILTQMRREAVHRNPGADPAASQATTHTAGAGAAVSEGPPLSFWTRDHAPLNIGASDASSTARDGHEQVWVVRNNELSRMLELIKRGDVSFTHVILGPGPGNPAKDLPLREFGELLDICNEPRDGRRIPVLGICLGMQFLVEHFGGTVDCCAEGVMHGKLSKIDTAADHTGLLPTSGEVQRVMRYHALAAASTIADGEEFPYVVGAPDLKVIAVSTENNGGKVVQAVHHAKHTNILGVQFHPESVGTKGGAAILRAFLEM